MHTRTLKAIEDNHQRLVKEKIKEIIEEILKTADAGKWEHEFYIPMAIRSDVIPAVREVFSDLDFEELYFGDYAQKYRVSWS